MQKSIVLLESSNENSKMKLRKFKNEIKKIKWLTIVKRMI